MSHGRSGIRGVAGVYLAGMIWLAGGCVAPPEIEPDLITRYQSALEHRPGQRAAEQGLGLLQPAGGTETLEVSKDAVTGSPAVQLTLEQTVRAALRGSPDIRVLSYAPAIAREQVIQAAAAFDAVVFGSAAHQRVHRQTSDLARDSDADSSRTIPLELGVRQHLPTGADAELAWKLTRTADNVLQTGPDPRWESVLGLRVTQPLLRRAGTEYNLAGLRIAAVNTRIAHSQFRQRVEEVVAGVQAAYWDLAQTRREYVIQQELLNKTVETLERLKKRRDLDVTQVEVKQAEVAVETRRAGLARARSAIFDAQDQLARLLGDGRINLIGRYVVVPTTPPATQPVTLDPTDQLVTALRFSPLLEQARLNIVSAGIRVQVARNEALPRLDLTGAVGIQGLKKNPDAALGEMFGFDYIDHSLGLIFEQPAGSRGAQAALRQRRLEKLKAMAEMQNTADQVAQAVNQQIRQIHTTYEEAKAQRAACAAAQVQLEALEDTERIRGQLTPEFLQLKLQAQETLANAERAESQATVRFNSAQAQLARLTGSSLRQYNIQLVIQEGIDYQPGPDAWPEETARPARPNVDPPPSPAATTTTSAP